MRHAKANLLNVGAVGSALAASICCIGPLVLAVSGLGGGALLLKFAPYRPYFLAVTGLCLAGAFYLVYLRSGEGDCGPDGVCSTARARRGQRIILGVVTVLVVVAAMFPYLMELFR
jgi:mercuric ion transport protein